MLHHLNKPAQVWTFGDSWAAGHGLKDNEKRFGDVIAEYFTIPHINHGKSGSSLGQILHQFKASIKQIKKNDIVLVVIPPDIRWYKIEGDNTSNSILVGTKEYKRFIKDKNPAWFIYHHSLFIYTFIAMAKQLDLNLVLAHNYGKLVFDKDFASIIEKKYFLNVNRCLTELLGGVAWKGNYHRKLSQDGPPEYIIGENFIPEDTHPNEQGHRLIADMILKHLEKQHVSNK